MNATLAKTPPSEWAALRTWAMVLRLRTERRSDADALIRLLDAQESLRLRHPYVAAELGKTARKLAASIAGGIG